MEHIEALQTALALAKSKYTEGGWEQIDAKIHKVITSFRNNECGNMEYKQTAEFENMDWRKLIETILDVQHWDSSAFGFQILKGGGVGFPLGTVQVCLQNNAVGDENVETLYARTIIKEEDNVYWIVITSIDDSIPVPADRKRVKIPVSAFRIEQDGPNCYYSRILIADCGSSKPDTQVPPFFAVQKLVECTH